MDLLSQGLTPQQARAVLPNATKTEIMVTMNLREWRHFLKLRTAKDAHPDMRTLTIPLLEEFKSKLPIIFDDIEV
jgi:thymidylate synthase (FAD)